jgi:phosphatidate cytidylyltransferase
MSKNLLARIAVAAVAIPIILTICYTGGYWYFGMIMLFALAGACEFLLQEGVGPKDPLFWLTLVFVADCLQVTKASVARTDEPLFAYLGTIWLMYFLLTGMVLSLGRRTPSELFQKHLRLLWGGTYLGILYAIVLALGLNRNIDELSPTPPNGDLLLFLFGLLWIGDTCAMGFGKWLGKHKLAPSVSPNKTVEGFIGGIIGAMAVGVLMYYWKFRDCQLGYIMLIAVGCSIFGQLGDLVESMWKRSLGIKDSSAIIPGHGGVLDRFDSLLFAAPFMYVCLAIGAATIQGP